MMLIMQLLIMAWRLGASTSLSASSIADAVTEGAAEAYLHEGGMDAAQNLMFNIDQNLQRGGLRSAPTTAQRSRILLLTFQTQGQLSPWLRVNVSPKVPRAHRTRKR